MLTFDTPGPIQVVLELAFGQAQILATDRRNTRVGMRPQDPGDPVDVRTAEHARVDYTSGRLLVSVPEPGCSAGVVGAVTLVIELPTGSNIHGEAVATDFRCSGTVGRCRFTTGLGHIRLDRTGTVRLDAAFGEITVNHVGGDAEATANSGEVRIDRIDGSATIRTTGEGDIEVGDVAGIVRARTDAGCIRIGSARAGVEALTSQGDILLEEVVRGSVSADTTSGQIDIGIADGTTAQLDLDCGSGKAYKSLSLLESRPLLEEHVHVSARTVTGDIVVCRSPASPDGPPDGMRLHS
ncbi:DUF4097 domain-containing protein [Streptomyces sp. NPDC057621]|uniref:DUF4097 family beta strand repeat-containing protein n=1 Tax=unclassified Streptomyces TaxID=2593676 RepID=UPI003455F5A6